MKQRYLVATLFLLGTLAGCQTKVKQERPLPPGVDAREVAALYVISVPVALNLDNLPGLDGVSLKVYANDYLNPKPVPIRQGSLQILMYDGPMGTNSAPLRTWNYGPEQLKQHEFRARIGTGYEFTLPWGDTPPRSKAVTMQADYRSADGRRVRSRPSSITVEDLPKR